MSGHYHNPTSASQNVGNSLGNRSCVRQSKLYRKYESGNGVKAVLGVSHLAWDEHKKQGAYAGHAVWDAERERPTHSRPVPSRLRDVDPDPYHTDRHAAGPARAPLAEYGRASMPSHVAAPAGSAPYFRDDREPTADPPRRSYPVGLDAYDRSGRAPPLMEARRGSFGSHDTRVPPPPVYERSGVPDRGYERAGFPLDAPHRETSHDRVFGGPEAQHAAPRTFTHHSAAPEASRPVPSAYGGYDAPPMYSRGENENISNLTGGVGHSSFDRDLEYAALNAKVSDVEKRMVLAAKTRPW